MHFMSVEFVDFADVNLAIGDRPDDEAGTLVDRVTNGLDGVSYGDADYTLLHLDRLAALLRAEYGVPEDVTKAAAGVAQYVNMEA